MAVIRFSFFPYCTCVLLPFFVLSCIQSPRPTIQQPLYDQLFASSIIMWKVDQFDVKYLLI